MKTAVIGAGWAGCAAAVEATRLGQQVTIFEAIRTPGGRARRVDSHLPDGTPLALDNGQHILIGAYSETLRLMADLGIDTKAAMLRLPLRMQFPDGTGLRLPRLPTPLDALVGILLARGWSWQDKKSLLRTAAGWQSGGFACAPELSVAQVCDGLTPTVMAALIEPLCVSALNTPADQASAQVFLRVMQDALFSQSGGSNLLLPRVDLSALLPDAALAWLARQGGEVRLMQRVASLAAEGAGWQIDGAVFDRVILACRPTEAVRLVQTCGVPCEAWLAQTRALTYEAITTVYAFLPGARLAQPMLALPASATDGGAPAQFVFDRGQLGGLAGLLAFVVSASNGHSAVLTTQVLAQADKQLGLAGLQPVQTIVEKRATFACLPGMQRPGARVLPGLLACGDYVDGPYPATLEGAVRSGLQAARNATE
ncbi:MAG TPA: hydroxysqualene dehydroxylase HpnE [Polaromonas sp.]|uniref:hydroxysqualene dehydroxylase HpnE n=1 Tax=Polaromonas sp. TaxID=1869339 RepID=UPI002D274BBC|nr:hydroxysqualene dehydroxylase HpnE [Polaromonas sp.]HYW58082.1 hydroxysqualene dehydroxylase HpnE [Polaromonas sp.]